MHDIYNFNFSQETWERPIHSLPNSESKKTYQNALTVDFKEKIKNKFLLESHRRDVKDRFPLIDDVGFYIVVNSTEKHIMPFVVKNAMDALDSIGYSDDGNITSVYAQHIMGSKNLVEIGIFSETIFSINASINIRDSIINFTEMVIPNDQIIQNPRTINYSLTQNPNNITYIQKIEQALQMQQSNPIYQNNISVAIDINTINNAGDVDNYALPYFIAMEDIIYSDLKNINCLTLNLIKNAKTDNSTIEIYHQ